MNIRFLVTAIRRHIAAASLTAAGVLSGSVPALAAWEHAHGDSANTGFAYVDTLPAERAMRSVDLGAVAPGANPVVAPDGTVYVGTMDGKLKAFRANGAPYWERRVNPEHGGIYAAPVVGADGSVYVVSTKPRGVLGDSYLHKFLPGGAWLGGASFPTHYARQDRGTTSAPPNIWRHNGEEVIIVLATYQGYSKERRLIAFSTNRNVIGNTMVSFTQGGVTGGAGLDFSWVGKCIAYGWWNAGLGCLATLDYGFHGPSGGPPSSVDKAGVPMPGVAIQPGRDRRGPRILVADGNHDRVGYTFSLSTGFTERFRITDNYNTLTTPPVALPDGKMAVGSHDGFLWFTEGSNKVGYAYSLGSLTAAPTRLHDGRLAVVSRNGRLTLLEGQSINYQDQLTGGQSIASAAASCTHLFVSTVDELVTYDANNMLAMARINWPSIMDGGLHAPVIGPTGYVYVIARLQDTLDIMYVFPRPATGGSGTPQGCANG